MLDFVPNFFLYLIIMASVTYLVRMIPLVCFRKKITNRFVRSFLYYVPYAVLSVMTVPGIFFATGHIISAVVGTLVALALSYYRKSLIVVASFAALAVLLAEAVIMFV
ncbi:MAG: AzlD domain-containing protein [Ruminococcaceae bacterium]|nr:AzlD domain-containing protein [Oscillospiraceae bacterium]